MSGAADTGTVCVRVLMANDIDTVMEFAAGLKTAPQWPRAVYARAVDPAILPQRVALAAEIGGQVVGFAIASVVPPEAELETIAVAAGQQRQGIGGALLAGLLGVLEARGIGELTLEVRASNVSAQAFYCANGFVEFARRPAYYPPPQRGGPVSGDPGSDTSEAAVLMRVRITARGQME